VAAQAMGGVAGGVLWVMIGITLLAYALVRSREALTLHTLAEADAIAFTKHFSERDR